LGGSAVVQLPEGARRITQIGGLCWGLVLLPAAVLVQRAARGADPRSGWCTVLGLALGGLLQPPLSAALGALAIGLSRRSAPTRGTSLPWRDQLWQLPGISLAIAAAGVAWMALRGPLAPTPDGTLVVTLAGGAVFLFARARGRLGGVTSVLLAALLGCATYALLGGAGGWTLPWTLTLVGDRGWLPYRFGLALPVMLIVLPGAALAGLAWGRRPLPLGGLGLAGGALVALQADGASGLLWGAGLACGAALLLSGRPLFQLASGGALAGVLATAIFVPVPVDDDVVAGRFRLLRSGAELQREAQADAGSRVALGVWGPAGAARLRAPAEAWEVRLQTESRKNWPLLVEQEGRVQESRGRAALGERFLGTLGALLDHRRDRVVVVGDTLGLVMKGLAARPHGLVRVATPEPRLVRAIAELDPEAQAAWLRPTVQLLPFPTARVLSGQGRGSLDLVLEVVSAPWADAASPGAATAQIDRVRRRLAPDGRYLAILHLGWWSDGTVGPYLAAVAARFDHVQLWLPPEGADSLVLVAGAEAPSLDALLAQADAARPLVRELGLPNLSTAAALAIADSQSTEALALTGQAVRPTELSDALVNPPVQHLSRLAAAAAPLPRLWNTADVAESALTDLERRREARVHLLELLGSAAAGDIEAVVSRSRQLSELDAAAGTRTLAPVIEPHLRDAREALAEALTQGPSSGGWEQAKRSATTAAMLAPRDPEPLVLLAEIDLARQAWESAQKRCADALALEADHLGALWCVARAARGRRDLVAAEDALQRAVEGHPRSWLAWHNLGTFLAERGRPIEGADALRKGASLAEPPSALPHIALAHLYLSQTEATRALVEAERALLLGGGPEARYLRGRAHFELGEVARAEKDFRGAVLSDSGHIDARIWVALCRIDQDDPVGARDILEATLALAPTSTEAREMLQLLRAEHPELTEQASPPPAPAPPP